ncbi:MAG: HAMP domain-containing histidine kinase [Defluviitaleaceae bacterium]|nr:HAMP domain-containing histidine kinase [Defluviitaleaceae bacterium]
MKKKISMHKRMLFTFIGILFFSFLLTGVLFDLTINRFNLFEHQYRLENEQPSDDGVSSRRVSGNTFISVGIMFAVATVATYFLSNSITNPIKKLGKFAADIGSGDFKPNDYEFQEIELHELNSVLNNTAKQLAEYDGQQKTFFQNASHELRTPLMSIKCYAEGISTGIMKPAQAAETILQETDRLTELVADLLYISRIDNIAANFSKSKTDILDILRQSSARQEAMANKREIGFVFDFDEDAIYLNCSQELISRAVDNLISNAIRYAKTTITLSCNKKGNYIFIVVADDGAGIEETVLPHVFERFYKGSGGNTGIGLSIVKSIVEQHGGTIAVENNGGAVFTIVMPRAEENR